MTGTSSGLGRSFVKAVIENGDYVVATARNRANLSELEEQYPDQMMALSLDVTKKEQIREVVQTVINTAGRIDVLINNAGSGYYGASKCALEGIFQRLKKGNRTPGDQSHGRGTRSIPHRFQRPFFETVRRPDRGLCSYSGA